jgi:hypothetical protein
MGRRVVRIVLLLVSGTVTVVIFAVAPIFFNGGKVLAAASSVLAEPHSCGGG